MIFGNGKNQSKGETGFTLIELIVVMAIVATLVTLLMPVLGKGLARGRGAYCLNNLRQLGLAIEAYADDNAGLLPNAEPLPSVPIDAANPLPRIRDVLWLYVSKSESLFKCPNDAARFPTEGTSYEWNFLYGGRDLTRLRGTKSPLMYDYDNVHDDRGGSGTKNILFADGHVSAP